MRVKRCSKCKKNETYTTSSWCKSCKAERAKAKRRSEGKLEIQKRDPKLLLKGLKECFECYKTLALPEFPAQTKGYGGVASYCRKCTVKKRAKNNQSLREAVKAHRQTQRWKEGHRNRVSQRKAKKKGLDSGNVTQEFIHELYSRENCYYCKDYTPVSKRSMDHVIPISKGGKHDVSNLVMACLTCNSSKRDLSEKEFKARGVLSKNTCS